MAELVYLSKNSCFILNRDWWCLCRLTEDTFTIDEVDELLNGLLTVVRGEVDSELIHTGHTNVLLLIQLFTQAEKWHLKLQADISELENRWVFHICWLIYLFMVSNEGEYKSTTIKNNRWNLICFLKPRCESKSQRMLYLKQNERTSH